jgi:serine/threonine-protein kinase
MPHRTHPDQTEIDAFVVRYEELLAEGGTLPDVEAICKARPDLLDELKRQLSALGSINAFLNGEETPKDDGSATGESQAGYDPAEGIGVEARIRLVNLHATGGLGEVFVARDENLGRTVALKRLRVSHRQNARSRGRFLREAEITGRLDHPGIVPVHGMGTDAKGNPFYTMRLAKGETLRKAIDHFHNPAAPGGHPCDFRSSAFRNLLGRFIAVCNTVAFAHSQGVVHRDLKPENILLGAYGETLVLDWGLAKEISGEDGPGPQPCVASRDASGTGNSCGSIDTRPGSSNELTKAGLVVGTPAYMSPEQAEGAGGKAGRASDIYSLGATFFALLTGQPPFRAGNVIDVLQQAKRETSPPPATPAHVPRALDAICRKAMAIRPEDRYPSSLALAADVEHWLADEPVSAYADPWTTRLRRWGSRHRTTVAAGAAACLVAIVSLVVAAALLNESNRRERDANAKAQASALAAVRDRDEAERQRARAAADFARARQAVDRFCVQVAKDQRLREHDLDGLRRDLLQTGAKFCDEFVRERSDDPDVLAEQGNAYLLLGLVTEQTTGPAAAADQYSKALAVFEQVDRLRPTERGPRRSIAQSHDALGTVYIALGRSSEALAAYQKALAIRQALAVATAASADDQDGLARSHMFLGRWHLLSRDWKAAQDQFGRALEIRSAMSAKDPTNAEWQAGAGDAHNNLAIVYRALNQPKKVEEELRQSLAARAAVANANPQSLDAKDRLGLAYNNLAMYYYDVRKPADSEAYYKKAQQVRAELAAAHPTISYYQHMLGRTWHNLGALYQSVERTAEADEAYRKGLAIHQQLAQRSPTVVQFSVDLGKSWGRLGHLVKATDPEAALEQFGRSAEAHAGALRIQPAHSEARESLGYTFAGRAEALDRLGRREDSKVAWERALEFATGPNRDRWRARLAITTARMGDRSQATAEADAAVLRSSTASDALFDAARAHALCAAAAEKDGALSEADRRKQADTHAARALELLSRAEEAGGLRAAATQTELRDGADFDVLRPLADFRKLLERLQPAERAP